MHTMELERLLTASELAEIIRRSEVSLRRDRAAGTGIPYVRVGGRVLYRPEIVSRWIEQHTEGEAA